MSRRKLDLFLAAIASDEHLHLLQNRKKEILERSTPVSFGTRYGMRQDLLPITRHVLRKIDERISEREIRIAEQFGVNVQKLKKR